jgi:hypothetical protein
MIRQWCCIIIMTPSNPTNLFDTTFYYVITVIMQIPGFNYQS